MSSVSKPRMTLIVRDAQHEYLFIEAN